MVKIGIEVCLISARGLKRTSSLLKLQWYAVGWIDSENKYCTTIDTSGKANPVWKTRFSTAVDEYPSEDLALHVEVYSRDPIFLRERLLGSATVLLKEFLDKYDAVKPLEEVGSFQLRKRNSDKPLGFVDISIRISEEKREDSAAAPYLDANEGFNLNLYQETSYEMPVVPPNYFHYPPAGGGSYQPPRPPPNVGYAVPSYAPSSYINMPSRGVGPGFGMGLAGGPAIFSGDFMSGSGASRDATVNLSTYRHF